MSHPVPEERDPPDAQGPSPRPVEATATLLMRAREGDEGARNELFRRYLPRFQNWAHGRLPGYARDLHETGDLVQMTVLRALSNLAGFEPRREGAFLAYLRQILLNQVRDEIRKVGRRPWKEQLPEEVRAASPSPLEEAIRGESRERYEAALAELPDLTQEAIIMRLELLFTYPEIADAIGSTPNAVRMRIARGLVQIWEAMK